MADVDTVNFYARRAELFYVEEIQLFEDEANTLPLDLTGLPLWMQLRKTYSAPPALTLSTVNGRITITNAALGKISLSIDAADLRPLALGEYLQDLCTMDVDNTVLWKGTFTIQSQVTREPA